MIYGINPCSLIDYPGKMSFVIFTGGCNLRCHYCHNKDIVNKSANIYQLEDVIKMLRDRKGFISSVTITGGEPTIHGKELIDLIVKIKELNYDVKLDTNGLNPSLLEYLIKEQLIDFIAMDIKHTFEQYKEITGVDIDIEKLKKSIKLIENSNINYEFRTTINKETHSEKVLLELFSYVKDKSKLILQNYRYSKNQLNDYKYTSYSDEELEQLKIKYNVSIR